MAGDGKFNGHLNLSCLEDFGRIAPEQTSLMAFSPLHLQGLRCHLPWQRCCSHSTITKPLYLFKVIKSLSFSPSFPTYISTFSLDKSAAFIRKGIFMKLQIFIMTRVGGGHSKQCTQTERHLYELRSCQSTKRIERQNQNYAWVS